MTAKEAQAFVGDEQCVVTILEDDKLFLVAPSSLPKSTSRRHRRDTSSEAMELLVRDCSPQVLITVVLTNFTLRSKFLVFFRSNSEKASGKSALYALRGNTRFLFTSSFLLSSFPWSSSLQRRSIATGNKPQSAPDRNNVNLITLISKLWSSELRTRSDVRFLHMVSFPPFLSIISFPFCLI